MRNLQIIINLHKINSQSKLLLRHGNSEFLRCTFHELLKIDDSELQCKISHFGLVIVEQIVEQVIEQTNGSKDIGMDLLQQSEANERAAIAAGCFVVSFILLCLDDQLIN